jgi:lysophospholipase
MLRALSHPDRTVEAALAKLMYLLSKPSLSPSDVRTLMSRPIRGEVTASTTHHPVVASVDGLDSASYGLHHPELAPTTCADLLARSARLALPQRLKDLASSGPATALEHLLDDHPGVDLDTQAVLHTAAAAGQAGCLRVLLERGASVHARHAGRTALEVCVPGGEAEKLLRTAGAYVAEVRA